MWLMAEELVGWLLVGMLNHPSVWLAGQQTKQMILYSCCCKLPLQPEQNQLIWGLLDRPPKHKILF